MPPAITYISEHLKAAAQYAKDNPVSAAIGYTFGRSLATVKTVARLAKENPIEAGCVTITGAAFAVGTYLIPKANEENRLAQLIFPLYVVSVASAFLGVSVANFRGAVKTNDHIKAMLQRSDIQMPGANGAKNLGTTSIDDAFDEWKN